MADHSGSGATAFLAFLTGGLIVAVAVLGLFVWNSHTGEGNVTNIPTHLTLNVKPSTSPSPR